MAGYYLYVHISPNNKYYIGITKRNPLSRWKNGYGYAGSPYFYNAIIKYGWNNFQHIILLENLSKEVACECEKYLIAKYHSNDKKCGYNICMGGDGTNGYHHTEKYKENLRNRKISAEQKLNISNTLKQRWKEGYFVHTGDNLRKNIPWNKGLNKDDLRVAKYIRKVGEFHHKEESKRKMSESHIGKPAHNRKKVMCIETEVIYDSVTEAQKITGINNISIAARDSYRTAGKLHWRYLENDNL